ncbi:MAG: DEAD/DEAH box helicase, partial [Aureliella sp.]
SQLVKMMVRASARGARLDREAAERFSKAMSTGTPQKKLALQIPESLAGPDVLLQPTVELHLEPKERHQLEARLRVACTELDDPPIPGLGLERTLVHTAAGVYHIVRDLAAEAAAAERVADQLGLGDFMFDGPYTWQLSGLEESLKIVERVRELGDAAPTVCWPRSKPLRLIGDITPQSLRVRLTSERDWFGIDGELNLEGLHVPLAELMVALRSGGRFVPLGDNQFATISEELRARMTAIDDVSSSDANGLRMARAAAPLVDEAIGLDIPAERDERWRQTIERLNHWDANPPEPPERLQAELRDYQVAGYQWLSKLSQWGLGGCLADDMGLGKTVQTLGVLLDRAEQGATLIVAPTSVGINWVRETERFAPSLKPHLYREHDRDHLIQTAGPGELIITSYQLLQRDIERVASRSWATLVLDEAQYIKNFQTKTNQAVRRLDVDWCVALSGTPLENHLGELWSLMRVLCPGLLGSWERFRQRFGEPIERDKNRERLQALGHVVRPFILRRTKQEVLTELPPRTEVVLTAELSPAERKRYDAARIAALDELTSKRGDENEQQRRIRVLSWLTRLRQLACHPGLVDPRWNKSSAKLDLFLETVNELRDNNHRALVFSQFVQHLSLLRAALDKQGIKYQYLDGSTPPQRRQEAVDAFQSGSGDLFLISLKAGGTGLNLTAADYVLHLDPWWNPAVEDQATDRAHRIGQLRPVTVYRLVAKDTIEEQILAMHEDKRELLAGVLDGADRAAKMSTQELVDLIRDTHQVTSHSEL